MAYKLKLLSGQNPNEPIDFREAIGTPHQLPTLNLRFVLVTCVGGETNYVTTNYVTQVTANSDGSYSFSDATPGYYLLSPV